MTKRNRFGRTAIAAVLALAAASGIGHANDKKLLWVQPMRDHPVHRLMQQGFLDKCKELGYTCDVVGNPSATQWDVAGSLPLAEAAIARTKYDAIGVYGPDPAIFPFISKLAGEGFPIVTWHVLPKEGSVEGLKAATGEDIANAGTNAAIAIGDKLAGKGTVAVTQGASNDTENAMSDAFRKTIAEKYPNIKVLDTQMEGFEPSAAEAKAELLAALAEGKTVPYLNPLPAAVITAKDLDKYYKILDAAGQ
jgi:ribose transport system substrate-binding protein